MKAVFNNVTIAESSETKVVEGNHYFPPGSIKKEFFKETTHHTTCPWKGLASYYTIEVDGKTADNAGWFYKNPSAAAKEIKEHVAFWRGVQIVQ